MAAARKQILRPAVIGDTVQYKAEESPTIITIRYESVMLEPVSATSAIAYHLYSLTTPEGFHILLNIPEESRFGRGEFVIPTTCCRSLPGQVSWYDQNLDGCCRGCGEAIDKPPLRMFVPALTATSSITPHLLAAVRDWFAFWYDLRIGPLESVLDGQAAHDVCSALSFSGREVLEKLRR